MDKGRLDISDELLENLSVEELVDLKIEVEGLLSEIDSIIETCDEAINS
jgi:hypothetical protein